MDYRVNPDPIASGILPKAAHPFPYAANGSVTQKHIGKTSTPVFLFDNEPFIVIS
jgi:hypothetical protein